MYKKPNLLICLTYYFSAGSSSFQFLCSDAVVETGIAASHKGFLNVQGLLMIHGKKPHITIATCTRCTTFVCLLKPFCRQVKSCVVFRTAPKAF